MSRALFLGAAIGGLVGVAVAAGCSPIWAALIGAAASATSCALAAWALRPRPKPARIENFERLALSIAHWTGNSAGAIR